MESPHTITQKDGHELTWPQQRTMRRLISHLSEENYKLEFKLEVIFTKLFKQTFSVIVDKKRSDAEEYSPRNTMCQRHYHFFMGPKGALEIVDAGPSLSLSRDPKHVENCATYLSLCLSAKVGKQFKTSLKWLKERQTKA